MGLDIASGVWCSPTLTSMSLSDEDDDQSGPNFRVAPRTPILYLPPSLPSSFQQMVQDQPGAGMAYPLSLWI